MQAGITIKPCRPEETAAVLDLWQTAEATPSVTDDIEELKRLVNENNDLFLIAEHDGRIVGTIIGGWDGWRGNIYRLAVLPEYRRQGIGRALVEEVESKLLARGARRISALVEHKHALAMSFWNSLNNSGYEPDPRMVRYVKTF